METGKSLDKDLGRQRVREILDEAKRRGPSDTDRVGERTAYRYLAAKSGLSASQKQSLSYGGLNSSGTLDGAFMSPAGDALKMIAKLTARSPHTVTARLTTQFSMDRQARQFRLPVDEEDTSLALWRINTPLVQSGEPETRNRKKPTEGIHLVK